MPGLRQAASLSSHAFGVEPVELEKINSVSTGNFSQYTCFTKKEWTLWGSNPGPTGYEPVALTAELSVHMNSTIFNFKSSNPVYFLPVTRQICDKVTDLASRAFEAEPVALNLSAINCRTFRRTSKQYQNLIFCKQTQNEQEGHSRGYPHRPIQI